MIELRGVRKSYGEARVLRGVSFRFPESGVAAITGPSGCGKTTLLRLILGLEAPDGGEIAGVPSMGAVFQEDRLIEGMSAAGNLGLVCGDAALVASHLAALGLAESAGVPARGLSGGMRRRVALARAALYESGAVALDEPFKGLDDSARNAAIKYALEQFAGRAVLIVSHDRRELEAMGAKAELRLY